MLVGLGVPCFIEENWRCGGLLEETGGTWRVARPFLSEKSDPSFSDSVIEEGKTTPEASVPVLKLSTASK